MYMNAMTARDAIFLISVMQVPPLCSGLIFSSYHIWSDCVAMAIHQYPAHRYDRYYSQCIFIIWTFMYTASACVVFLSIPLPFPGWYSPRNKVQLTKTLTHCKHVPLTYIGDGVGVVPYIVQLSYCLIIRLHSNVWGK